MKTQPIPRRIAIAPLLCVVALTLAFIDPSCLTSDDTPVPGAVGTVPQVAFDGSDIFVFYSGSVLVSRDQGRTWSSKAIDSRMPTAALAASVKGEAHLVWEREHDTSQCDRRIMYARVKASNLDLSPEQTLSGSPGTSCSFFPNVGANASGVIVVTWTEGPAGSGARSIFARRSQDNGATWEDIQPVTNGNPSVDSASVAVLPSGDAYLAYRTNGSSPATMLASWPLEAVQPQAASTFSTKNAGTVRLESGADGSLLMAYGSGTLYLAVSQDRGLSWTKDLIVTAVPGTGGVYPNVAGTAGRLLYLWCDLSGSDGPHLRVTATDDVGTTWTSATQVDDVGGPVHCDNGLSDSLDAQGLSQIYVFRRNTDGQLFFDLTGK